MEEPKFVAATLRWCNRQRAKKGKAPLKKLPKGVRQDSMSCPCGAATGLSVGITQAYDPVVCEWMDMPEPVTQFVVAFDRGDLPQYVLGRFRVTS